MNIYTITTKHRPRSLDIEDKTLLAALGTVTPKDVFQDLDLEYNHIDRAWVAQNEGDGPNEATITVWTRTSRALALEGHKPYNVWTTRVRGVTPGELPFPLALPWDDNRQKIPAPLGHLHSAPTPGTMVGQLLGLVDCAIRYYVTADGAKKLVKLDKFVLKNPWLHVADALARLASARILRNKVTDDILDRINDLMSFMEDNLPSQLKEDAWGFVTEADYEVHNYFYHLQKKTALEKHREYGSLSVKQFSEMVGISDRQLRSYEAVPDSMLAKARPGALRRMSEVLQVPEDYLVCQGRAVLYAPDVM